MRLTVPISDAATEMSLHGSVKDSISWFSGAAGFFLLSSDCAWDAVFDGRTEGTSGNACGVTIRKRLMPVSDALVRLKSVDRIVVTRRILIPESQFFAHSCVVMEGCTKSTSVESDTHGIDAD